MSLELDDRADFDGASYGVGDPGRHRDSFVQVFAIQDVEAGELLLRFGEGAIGNHCFAVANADGCRAAGRQQRCCTSCKNAGCARMIAARSSWASASLP